jgi:anaerobic nitric oxide reductase transcription regulator
MVRLKDEIRLVAPSDLPVLITGETGTGKELIALELHAHSTRGGELPAYVNCAAVPETVAGSELFGHVKGAFTGALGHRAGKFESADGGTLFLDEIGELPLSIQPMLLRALESGEIQRIGSDRNAKVNVRIVAATNRNLEELIRRGLFRRDLFHRLLGFEIHAPALRDHLEDIPLIAAHLMERAQAKMNWGPVRFSQCAMEALTTMSWPGNVRELDHLLMRAALRASQGTHNEPISIDLCHLDLENPTDSQHPTGFENRLDSTNRHTFIERTSPKEISREGVALTSSFASAVTDFKRHMITDAVKDAEGNWAKAARKLKLHRSNLYRIAAKLGLKAETPNSIEP